VHVGDHYYADVLGARAAGVYPVLLDRGEWSSNPDCTVITTLLDLPELLLSGSILP